MKTWIILAAFLAATPVAYGADWDDDYPPPPAYAYPPPPAYAYPLPPPAYPYPPPSAYAYRPPGSPPGVVFFAPNPAPPSHCLPGFFWRVYPDGSGECWPWEQ